MLLLAHPSGNTFFRAAARSFYSVGWLREVHSCICWNTNSAFAKLLPASLSSELTRRSFNDLPMGIQRSHPWRELARLLCNYNTNSWLSLQDGPFCIDAVYNSFDRNVAARLPNLTSLRAVYSYEDAALTTFQSAERLGLQRIYDLPIGYWRSAQQIFLEERELEPEWACTLTGLNDSAAKLSRKDQELELANLVVVPSEFVRSTLIQHNACCSPIAVVPFGSPSPLAVQPRTSLSNPLKLLYVGSLGQRKGLSYALAAVQALGSQVSLTMIGKVTAPNCGPLLSALDRHRWIETLPHHQILKQMREHDVLLLPSLFEGYALVISEALAQGLPVLTTPNSGGTYSIRDGVEGFIVPIRDSLAIADRIQVLIDNRDILDNMRKACLRRASELSWASYEQGLRREVSHVLFKS